MAKAYSYLRFSTPEQARGDSFRRQTELAKSYAVQNGLELDEELQFHDLGVSAFYGRNAKMGALRKFLDRIESGDIAQGSFLLVENFDRISRDEISAALGLFLQIINGGITLVTLMDEKTYNKESVNANPMDILFSLIIMMRAREESETRSKRSKACWQNKRNQMKDGKRGIVFPASVPVWLKIDKTTDRFEIIKERVEIVKLIFKMARRGTGNLEIARYLNRKRIPTFNDLQYWNLYNVAHIRRNEAVTGTINLYIRERHGEKKIKVPIDKIKNYYPQIISSSLFNVVKAQTENNRIPKKPGIKPGRNIFCEIAKCSECGSSIVSSPVPNSRHMYLRCKRAFNGGGCTSNSRIEAVWLEKAFIQNIKLIIASVPKFDTAGMNTINATSNDSVILKLNHLFHSISLYPRDVPQINSLLRQLFSSIVINIKYGQMSLNWARGGTIDITYT
jgi:DNA invertase Pin-like site-specific DNA recombinase